MFFNIRKKKQLESNNHLTSKEIQENDATPSQVRGFFQEGVVHCCCSVSPEALENLAHHSKLDFLTWYKALWYMQHQPIPLEQINVRGLKDALKVSWPTAKTIKQKIILLLEHHA